jgi:hypothetical protein
LHKSPGKEEKYREETKQEIPKHVEDVRYAHNEHCIIQGIRLKTLPTHQLQIFMCFLKGYRAPLGMVNCCSFAGSASKKEE